MENSFKRMVDMVAKLRSDEGCLWDKEQTPASAAPYLIEEAYEVIETIAENDQDNLKEELGDLLLQVIFQAQIAAESGAFTIKEVLDQACEKLIRRHPHVFAGLKVKDVNEILANWERIKQSEKKDKSASEQSPLSGIPKHLPSLLLTRRVQDKLGRFDSISNDPEDAVRQVDNNWSKFKENAGEEKDGAEKELGNLLFHLVNLARMRGLDAETILRNKVRSDYWIP
ncbi:MAG: nucleoside triphosphate pyrophosphohydrolase [bacterium]|nr:nucleoside triphosphate pyrophosphohydrolase [bacterium]